MLNHRRLFIKKLSALGFGSLLTTGCVTTGGSFGPLVRKEDSEIDEEFINYVTRFIEDNRKQKFSFKSNSVDSSKKAKYVFDTIEQQGYVPYLLDLPTENQINALIRNLEKEKSKHLGKKDLTIEELYELNKAIVPVARAYVDINSLSFSKEPINFKNKSNITYKRDGTLVIRPGYKVKFTQRNFCLEEKKPSPEPGSLIYLDYVEKRIPTELRDIYDSLKKVNKNRELNSKYEYLLKNLFWAVSEAGIPGSKFEQIKPEEFRALDEIHPGASSKLFKYHEQRKNQYVPNVEQPIRNNPIINYQEIKEGLFTKTDKVGVLKSRITLVNTTDKDIPIDLTNYVIENPQKTNQAMSVMAVDSLDNIDEDKIWMYPDQSQLGLVDKLKKKLDNSVHDLVRFLNNFGLKNISQNPVFIKFAARTLGNANARFLVENLPILGSGLSLYEALSGKSWVNDRPLNAFERTASLLGVVPGAKFFTKAFGQKSFAAAQLIFTGAGAGANAGVLPSDVSNYVKTYTNPLDVTPLVDPSERQVRKNIVEQLTMLEKGQGLTLEEKGIIKSGLSNIDITKI